MTRSLVVEPARPEERADAFGLVFQYLATGDRDARVTTALQMIDKKEADPEGLFVAREGAGVVGALLCQPMPGAAAVAWPPQTRQRGRPEIEDELVRHAAGWLRTKGVKVAQALMPPSEAWMAAPLERHGFQHITRLWYLRKRVNQDAHGPRPVGLELQTYLQGPELFHQTLLRSYEGTLDCPELTGVRTIGEIIEGHKAQGAFNPEVWWLALEAGRPVGVLLIAETPEWESWDVSYVGVVPEARRRGLGRTLVRLALAEARRRKAHHLTIAVDARNLPAQKLYEGLGFEPFDEREVFLAVWQ